MSRLILMTVGVLLLTTVAVAPASARSRRQKPEHSWDNLKKLRVGEEIQVVYQQEQYLNGRFVGFTPVGISVQWGVVNMHKETIPRKDVIRVISWKRTKRVKNTLLGLGMGAAGGAALGAGLAHEAKHQGKDMGFPTIAIPIGAAAGAVLGALNPDHETIYLTQESDAKVVAATASSALVHQERQRAEHSWDNLRTLRIFQKIHVLDQKWRSHERKFLSVSEEAISFDAGRGEVTIRRAHVLEVKAERPQHWGQSGSGVWADTVTVYRAEPWEDLGSSWVGSVSEEPACGCSSETTTWGDVWERECDRQSTETKTVRRERKPRNSHRYPGAEIVLTTAPLPDSAGIEVSSPPAEFENPTEHPQPETEVSERSTPDSAEPPEPEERADRAPFETEVSQPEEATPEAAEPADPPPIETEIAEPEGFAPAAAEGR